MRLIVATHGQGNLVFPTTQLLCFEQWCLTHKLDADEATEIRFELWCMTHNFDADKAKEIIALEKRRYQNMRSRESVSISLWNCWSINSFSRSRGPMIADHVPSSVRGSLLRIVRPPLW